MPENNGQGPHHPYPTLSGKEAAVELRRILREFFTHLRDTWEAFDSRDIDKILRLKVNESGKVRIQIRAPAGLGKTQRVIEEISQLRGKVVWYMVPDKKLAKEVEEKLRKFPSIRVFRIEGRSEDNCERNDLQKYLGSRGVDIQKTICNAGKDTCPFYAGCPYQNQIQQAASVREEMAVAQEKKNIQRHPVVYVMTHDYLTNPTFVAEPDLVVVDEAHRRPFIHHFNLPFQEMRAAARQDVAGCERYKACIEEIIAAIKDRPTGFLTRLKPQVSGIDQAISHLGAVLKESSKLSSRPPDEDGAIRAEVSGWKIPLIKKVLEFLTVLKWEAENRNTPYSIQYNMDSPDHVTVHVLRKLLIEGTTPLLIIDGTADAVISQMIWGKSLRTVEISAERNLYTVQVTGKSFSKFSLGIGISGSPERKKDREALMGDVISFINRVAEESEKPIFLAAPKKILDLLSLHLSPKVLTANYAALRGRNEFENCETAIILSREEPNPSVVEDDARALLSRNDGMLLCNPTYLKAERNRRMRGGGIEPEDVPCHPNPLCQRLLEQIRERELEQAIDRLRVMHNVQPKKIFILSSLVLDITVDKALRWKDMKKGGTRLDLAIERAFEKSPAFPLSPAELARLFPDLWESRDAAKSYFARMGGDKWVESHIKSYKGNDPFNLAAYRTPGMRGKKPRAFVWAGEKNPQGALERVLGRGVTDFEILDLAPKTNPD